MDWISILMPFQSSDVGYLQSLTQPVILVLHITFTIVENCDIMVFFFVDLIYGLQLMGIVTLIYFNSSIENT